jgi:subtilase family serine protease
MNRSLKLTAPLVAAIALSACNVNGGSANLPARAGVTSNPAMRVMSPEEALRSPVFAACPGNRQGQAQCDVLVHSGVTGDVIGWTPADLRSAYRLPSSSRGSGQIVAIVDSLDNPNVASDLAVYRSHFGLGPATFAKFNQKGERKDYPPRNVGWGVEIDLDVEMVSAVCPKCTIELYEANSTSWRDVEATEAEAVKRGAHIVSNSYSGTGAERSYYDAAGVTYLAASGDSGYGSVDPGDFGSVVSVGGTMLAKAANRRGWSEAVWPYTGGGCSTRTKPPWQRDPDCHHRMANDVAAVAEDVAEYDSYGSGSVPWFAVDGTSISTPLLAGVFGLAGNATSQAGGKRLWTLTARRRNKDLFPITEGSDGICAPLYYCTAGTGEYKDYSGPTGWGTPDGIDAF